jgi:cysteine desulfurase
MEIVPSGPSGTIDPEALAGTLDHRVKLVCVTWAPAVSGIVNPIGRIAAVLEDHPAWLFVDAAQAFGNIITNLSHSRFDLVAASGRKYLRGPRGTGFAAYSPRFLASVEPLGLDQGSGPWGEDGPAPISGARRYEFRETSFAVRLGLAAAVKVALARDLDADMSAIQQMAIHLRETLTRVPGVTVQDAGADLSGIVTFSHDRLSPVEIRQALRARGINIAAPQTPYGPLWFTAGHPPVARLSPHAFNTQAEIEEAIDAIAGF